MIGLRAIAGRLLHERLAGGRHFGDFVWERPGQEMVFYAPFAYVVEATKDGKIEYWAVATHRDDALHVLRVQLPPDWNLILAERRLSGEETAELKMKHNTIRKLEAAPEKG